VRLATLTIERVPISLRTDHGVTGDIDALSAALSP
jgi:hypothetical protein